MDVMSIDVYSMKAVMGGVAKTLTSANVDSDYIPLVLYERQTEVIAIEGNGSRPSHLGGVSDRWKDVHIEHI